MYPTWLHSYLLWRSSVPPDAQALASRRFTATVSLIPAIMVGMFVFGWWAGLIVTISIATALVTDIICHKYIWKDSVGTGDGIWLLTGLILALFMPPNVGWWVPVLGSVVAIAFGKYWSAIDNMPLFQPAIVGLVALYLAAFAGQSVMHENFMLSTSNGQARWPVLSKVISHPQERSADGGKAMAEIVQQWLKDFFGGDIRTKEDALRGPRPIDEVKSHPGRDVSKIPLGNADNEKPYDSLQMVLGYVPSTIGGASALALFLGILLLIFTGTVHWVLPTSALATLFGGLHLFAWLTGGGTNPAVISENIPVHLLSGTTLLAIFYLAADPMCVPRSFAGKVYAGVGFGVIELLMRLFTPGVAEGVVFSVIVVQALAYVIDIHVAPPVEQAVPSSSVGLTSSTLGRL